MDTTHLFPVPISTFEIPAISKEIVEFIKEIEYVPWHNSDNYYLSISKERQVLDTFKILSPLRENVLKAANQYWHEVICADHSLNLKIRHSWITRHRPGEWNPAHTHTTSLFTSCTYIQAGNNAGRLILKKDTNYLNLFPSMVDLDYHTNNLINTKKFVITPKDNLTVFFPSHVLHETEANTSNEDRYALNMDYWFEGPVRKNSNGFDTSF
jgi:uncharacterized protein (TIGR02466 family)